MANTAWINGLSLTDAYSQFLRCCGSTYWARGMTDRRPFVNDDALLAAAAEVFRSLSAKDWLEAFAAHPQIGDLDSLRKRFAATATWSAQEQAGMAGTGEVVLRALAERNQQYAERFGHIFIVCATGKSAAEMLAILEQRLANRPDHELAIAAGEQQKITRLRLEKL